MKNNTIRKLISTGCGFTADQAVASGISRQTISDYCNAGKLIRLGRGVYLPNEGKFTDSPEIEYLQRKGKDFVLCLFSALQFYHIGTQNTPDIWIAIKNTKHQPIVDFSLKCIRCRAEYYDLCVETHHLNGLPVKIYSPAKTIVDCFRFRNVIGLDVALEALRDGWRKHSFTMDELFAAAQTCRVMKIMTPYLEMLAG